MKNAAFTQPEMPLCHGWNRSPACCGRYSGSCPDPVRQGAHDPHAACERFFYGEPIEIPYRTKGLSHGPATSFQCEDLAELAHQLPDRLGEGYEAKRFGGDSLLIWRTLPAACYLIQRQTGEKAGSRCNFLLFDMEARLGVGATEQTFVFPYHLIALMESQGTLYFRFDPGVLYETAYSKQEFLNFYRRLGQYTVTETWDGFQIMRGKGSVSASDEAREENSEAPSRSMDLPVQFLFTQDGSKAFLHLSTLVKDSV